MTTMPVGLSRDLRPKRVMRAQVADQDLVLWRTAQGQIAAWDNRCPHRGMALSHGFVRGGMLACLYHGWHYGPDGGCKAMPAHPGLEPPETIRARAFGVTEASDVIWVALEGEAASPTLPDGLTPFRSFAIHAAPEVIMRACADTYWQGEEPTVDSPVVDLGGVRLVLLTNPLGPALTQVTTLIDHGTSPADCATRSRWIEAMRRVAEAAG